MHILRTSLLALALLALSPIAAHAQQAVAGSTFRFDHDAASALDTERYELCVDTVSDATCTTIGVVREGVTDTYRFTLPASVARGNRALSVRAVGLLGVGASGPSNIVTVRVIGIPSPPSSLRQEVP